MDGRSAADELYDRLTEALGSHDLPPDDRRAIQDAYVAAGMDTATWDDLPMKIQKMILKAENSPRTTWDDPADVPDIPNHP
jgi:hypothetical protein